MDRPDKATSHKSLSTRKDSRGALIDAALAIILEEGVDNLRLEDVCDRVGAPKARFTSTSMIMMCSFAKRSLNNYGVSVRNSSLP